jgi:DNA-binding MurR/RpiR family transcriptional regulator
VDEDWFSFSAASSLYIETGGTTKIVCWEIKKGKSMKTLTDEYDEYDEMFKKIKRILAESTSKQRMVAAYYLENHEQAVFMSIPQLAEAIQVSTATITRFAQELGYSTFSAFHEDFRKLVRGQLKPATRLRKRSKLSDQLSDQIQRCCAQDLMNIQQTYENIDQQNFKRAAEMIIDARWIWVVGFRGSYMLAYETSFNLNQILRKITLIGSSDHNYLDSTVMIKPNDLMIAFSFSRFSKLTIEVVREAKKRDAKTLTFSDRIVSPLTPYSDVGFVVQVNGMSFHNSYVAAMSLINCLILEIATKDKEHCMKNLKDLDETLLQHGTFLFG